VKRVIAAILLMIPTSFGMGKEVTLGDVTITMAGGEGTQENPCWLHVSNGKTLFVLRSNTFRVFGQNCTELRIGQHVSGGGGGGHYVIEAPDKHGDLKRKTYRVISKSAAGTTQ
jgi:hypothetical protein